MSPLSSHQRVWKNFWRCSQSAASIGKCVHTPCLPSPTPHSTTNVAPPPDLRSFNKLLTAALLCNKLDSQGCGQPVMLLLPVQIFLLTPRMYGACNRRPRMFLVAACSAVAAVVHPEFCGHVIVVPPAIASSGVLPLADMAIPLPPSGSYCGEHFHAQLLDAMEAASHVWDRCQKLGDFIDSALGTESVQQTCTHQVLYCEFSDSITSCRRTGVIKDAFNSCKFAGRL
jgi:hypothetical protein